MSGPSVLGELVRSRMAQLGLRRHAMALEAGMSPERADFLAIRGWTGEAMTLTEAAGLAHALELPVDDLAEAAMADRKARA